MLYPIKGYLVASGYMGLVGSKYMLFATEEDYLNYISELEATD